jgi:hypothetical protein
VKSWISVPRTFLRPFPRKLEKRRDENLTALEDVANHKILHEDHRDLFREYPRFDGRVVTLTSPRSRCEHLCGGRLTGSREVAELFVAPLFGNPKKGTRYSTQALPGQHHLCHREARTKKDSRYRRQRSSGRGCAGNGADHGRGHRLRRLPTPRFDRAAAPPRCRGPTSVVILPSVGWSVMMQPVRLLMQRRSTNDR